jgi:hypothetical protein
MPLVQEKWGPHGLTNWTVLELDGKDGWSVYVFSAFTSNISLFLLYHYLPGSLCTLVDREKFDVI